MKNLSLILLFLLSLSFTRIFGDELKTNWTVGFHKQKETDPEKWIPAQVPGAVQLDYAKANNWGLYYYAENWKDYGWMEDVFWTYKTVFSKPRLGKDQRFYFVSEGIDYEFEISINDKKILYWEGMFTRVSLDLTDYLQQNNELEVTIFPAPKIPGKPATRKQAAQSCKPAVSYGWDWHPRLIPLGIWDTTGFQILNQSNIEGLSVNYTLTDNLDQADIRISLNSNKEKGLRYEWTLKDPAGAVVLTEKGNVSEDQIVHSQLKNPRLWWPHDHGDQPLYVSEVILKDPQGRLLDRKNQRIGFRRIRLVMNEGTWQEPVGFPKTRSNPPITVEINNRKIFSKGTNWVNPEIFPGMITRERYEELLDKAVEANFNLLRCWGGAIVNKESFYNLCDEKGIMVWTEFPLACNNYEGTPKYLSILKQEATSIIRRVSQHPSNVLWCGGNELFNSWSGMTDQSLAIRLLNSLCFSLDQETPFIPTAPIMGVGHGNYVFQDFGIKKEEVFQVMPRAHNTAYTEFGMPGPSSVEILKQIIPENELFPPKKGTSWESHHAFGAWEGDTWLMKDLLYEYFGEQKNLESLVEVGQWLQSEGYKCIFEEARRQKPYCSMAMNWCYNEPWPTAANNSLINYPCKPKPAYKAVKASCRPVLASARIPKFRWNEGEEFSFDLFILNDSYKEFPKGKINIILSSGNQKIETNWEYPPVEQNKNLKGPAVHYELPYFNADRLTLSLFVEDHPEWNSQYTLIYHPKGQSKQ